MKYSNDKVVIDFPGGAHGNFLRYVVATYIFGEEKVENIFNSVGASHIMPTKSNVIASHCSVYSNKYPTDTSNVIYISCDISDNFIILVNSFYRAGSSCVDKINNSNKDIIKLNYIDLKNTQSACDIRNQFFNKILSSELYPGINNKIQTKIPVYNFKFASFLNASSFLLELKQISDFLNLKLLYNRSLIKLYDKFIELNTGVQLLNHANHALRCIYVNKPFEIMNNDFVHAYINSSLSSIFCINDGVLYTDDTYPNDTTEIYKIVTQYINDFDKKYA
jgi:hypothetical protein